MVRARNSSEALAMRATRQNFSEATTMPGLVYWASDVFRTEMERLFTGMWLCAGHQNQLSSPGDFLTIDIGQESILLIADENAKIRAFHNFCRHRGTRLMSEAAGKLRSRIQCPYHAWNYSLDGSLAGAPRMEDTPGFCKEDYPLVQVLVDTFQGFVFISLDDQVESLAESLEDFPDLSRYGLEQLRRGATRAYEVEANWKLVAENFSECYHCALVHPQLHQVTDSHIKTNAEVGICYNGGPMVLNEDCTTLTMSGVTDRPLLAGLEPEDYRLVRYYNLYPNLLLSLHPDYVLAHLLLPLDENRTRIRTDWFFAPSAMDSENFDPGDAVEFWDLTNKQDWGLCETAHKGLHSSGHIPGRFQRGEVCVHAFDKWYLERMGLGEQVGPMVDSQ